MKDRHGRTVDYLRVSITDRCNYRCKYCMPEEGVNTGSKEDILSLEGIVKLVRASNNLGIHKVRLTGGEPLVRRGIEKLISMLNRTCSVEDLSLTTNGSLLKEKAQALARSGLNRVNISLDSLDPETFNQLTRVGNLDHVLDGIRAAKEADLNPIKLNAVMIEDVNDDEALDLAQFALDHQVVVRYIGLMPMGEAASSGLRSANLDQIRNKLEKRWTLQPSSVRVGSGPASYYQISEGGQRGKIGFIFARQHPFCKSCNKIRVTSRGALRPCLAREEELLLPEPPEQLSQKRIEHKLHEAIEAKPFSHNWSQNESTSSEMSTIGG